MKKTISIELKSDLCVSSGFSFAGIVDNDVSYDKYGIPYISGRRIKGCLRDASKLFKKESLFGTIGKNESDSIVVGNAFPKGYKDLVKQIETLKKDEIAKQYVSQENILTAFTSLKAQTKLLDGVAEENTLRYTRIINQYFVGKNLIFEAPITFSDNDYSDINNCVRAVKNIGLKRNRGLGSVSCSLEDSVENVESLEVGHNEKNSDMYHIQFTIKNEAPIIVSGEDEQASCTYINGASLLGILADRYLKKNGKIVDEQFKNMFLNPNVMFSNLYPFVNGNECLPVPSFIRELKKTKKLVNMTQYDPGLHNVRNDVENKYNTYDGNAPKKIRNKYLYLENGEYKLHEVATEILYHHRHADGNQEEQLYYLEAIEAGQTFKGEIICPKEYAIELVNLLTKDDLYFGKSKSAQYGKCSFESITVNDYEKSLTNKTGKVMVILDSDAIFQVNGNYTINRDEVRTIIAEKLGLTMTDKKEDSHEHSFILTKTVTGYSSVHNLRKPEIPAIVAGSAFDFEISEPIKQLPIFLGEKSQEGYGRYHIFYIDDYAYELNKKIEDQKKSKNEENPEHKDGIKIDIDSAIGKIAYQTMKDHLLDELFENVNKEKLNIKSAALGRLTLMLIDAENSEADTYTDLWKRVNSIKSKDTKKEISRYLESILGVSNVKDNAETNVDANAFENGRLMKKLAPSTSAYQNIEAKFTKEIADQCVKKIWTLYLKNHLVYQKYMKG